MTQTPNIKKGDSVKLQDGTIHEISSIQYVHDRYQLLGVSNWKYGINDLVLTRPQAAYFYWLQEAARLKEYADAAYVEYERTYLREQQLRELMKDALGCMVMFAGKDDEHVQRIVKVFRTLYPDTPAPTPKEDLK